MCTLQIRQHIPTTQLSEGLSGPRTLEPVPWATTRGCAYGGARLARERQPHGPAQQLRLGITPGARHHVEAPGAIGFHGPRIEEEPLAVVVEAERPSLKPIVWLNQALGVHDPVEHVSPGRRRQRSPPRSTPCRSAIHRVFSR